MQRDDKLDNGGKIVPFETDLDGFIQDGFLNQWKDQFIL